MNGEKRERGKALICSFSSIVASLSFLSAPVSLSHGFAEESVADCGHKHDLKSVLLNSDIGLELFI